MTITLRLPDDIGRRANAGRTALEALAIEGYRSGALTHGEAGHLLGLSRFEFDEFLMERDIEDHAYGVEDLEQDIGVMERLREQGHFSR